ncbi:MAG: O-antigen ligase family protein [Candidatus Nomurabacteria bacterium]|jgi:hypothetical protein|nr:O-antigen ligase family protein [Candidatus Nomurabacteria bacterium]
MKIFSKLAILRNWLVLKNVGAWKATWLFAPITIWFSYRPLISLGRNETMHFELSVVLIYILILALMGLSKIWHGRHKLVKNKAAWLTNTFVIWNLISLLWTENLTRGILTCGIVGILWLIFLATIVEKEKMRKILPALVKIFIASAVVMCVLAWVQMIGGIWLSQSETLLCNGCVAAQFGFVRPNVFTIEPQFFGNILLVPILILLWQSLEKKANWRMNLVFIFLVSTLFLTLSRGAIFAFGLGAVVLLILQVKFWRQVLFGVGLIVSGFILALVCQGVTAVINPNFSETFSGAVNKSLNHLSMGIIDLRGSEGEDLSQAQNIKTDVNDKKYFNEEIEISKQAQEDKQNNEKIAETEKIIEINSSETKNEPQLDGYVEESTNVRLKMSEVALKAWAKNPQTIAFGVGVGGAGSAMNEVSDGEIGSREIVQNEFIEILLENGLVGGVIFLGMIFGLFYATRREKFCWAIIAAFLVQWNFFSGYPNALHIYLIFIVMFAYFNYKNRKE